MKNITFIITLAAMVFMAAPASADMPLLPVTWDGSLAEPWTPPMPATKPGANNPFELAATVSERVQSCQQFKVRWSESSARKLYRALKFHDADLQDVDLQPWVNVQVTSQRALQAFSVHPQNAGKSVGVVPLNPDWNLTYTVAQTKQGPVVASQTWPSPHELDNGATCRPVASRIEFPDERRVDVNIEPFRMWGMRVAEALPASLFKTDPYEALVAVIRATDGSSASMY